MPSVVAAMTRGEEQAGRPARHSVRGAEPPPRARRRGAPVGRRGGRQASRIRAHPTPLSVTRWPDLCSINGCSPADQLVIRERRALTTMADVEDRGRDVKQQVGGIDSRRARAEALTCRRSAIQVCRRAHDAWRPDPRRRGRHPRPRSRSGSPRTRGVPGQGDQRWSWWPRRNADECSRSGHSRPHAADDRWARRVGRDQAGQ